LPKRKTMLAKAKGDLDRIKPLAEINAVSKSDLDEAVAAYEARISSLEAARATLRAAKIELGYTKIYSPIDGIIGKSRPRWVISSAGTLTRSS
jgi:membrane fusion protein (multidrug efflux system)